MGGVRAAGNHHLQPVGDTKKHIQSRSACRNKSYLFMKPENSKGTSDGPRVLYPEYYAWMIPSNARKI